MRGCESQGMNKKETPIITLLPALSRGRVKYSLATLRICNSNFAFFFASDLRSTDKVSNFKRIMARRTIILLNVYFIRREYPIRAYLLFVHRCLSPFASMPNYNNYSISIRYALKIIALSQENHFREPFHFLTANSEFLQIVVIIIVMWNRPTIVKYVKQNDVFNVEYIDF